MKRIIPAQLLLVLVLFFPAWIGSRQVNFLPLVETVPSPVNSYMEQDASGPEYSGCGGTVSQAVNADYEQKVVEMVNQQRKANNLPPLKRADGLENAARYHAADLAQDNYFNHDTYDRLGGKLVFVCSTWDRIATYYQGANAENIAAGYGTPADAMNAWMSSGGHRDNILNPWSWEIGVGYYQGSGDYYRYWVQDFGRRNGIYPLIINDEAEATHNRSVSVFVYGNWQEMRLRNDNGSWTAWRPFQARFDWSLASGVGEHTVWAELRDSSQTVTSSDTIYLTDDQGLPVLDNLPDSLAFIYSIPDQQVSPESQLLIPLNTAGTETLAWEVKSQGDWFFVNPLQGTTPQSLLITPANLSTSQAITYTGTVTITVSSPTNVIGSPHTIKLALEVVDAPLHKVYLPEIQR